MNLRRRSLQGWPQLLLVDALHAYAAPVPLQA
jgi:hypothetical protein